MKSVKWLLLVALAMGLIGPAAAIDESGQQRVSLPPMVKAPVIDGVIGADEWAAASKVIGFTRDPRDGFTLVGYDAANLYIAQSTELPPSGELITEVLRHDSNTCMDDSIEIWLDPNRQNKIDNKGDQRFYQMIINSAGVFFDQSTDPETGANLGWDLKGYQFKSRIDKDQKVWQLELAIPWKSLGVDASQVTGRQVGVMVARNWKIPWTQAPAMGGGFSAWQPYPVFTLASASPVVREESLGDVWNANADYKLSITNPGKTDLKCKVELRIDSSDMPGRAKNDEITVPAGQTVAAQLAYPDGALHKEAIQTISARVTSADGKDIYFNRNFTAGPVRAAKWDAVGPANANKNLLISYYPSSKKLAVKVDVNSTTAGDKLTGADIAVLDPAGKSLKTGTITLANKTGETILELPELPDGNYLVRATLKGEGAPEKPLEREFNRKHFVWENNTLGMTDRVYPPFAPVTTKGNTLGVVLRSFKMNGFGLWDSVISKGKEILAGPITVDGIASNGPVKWSANKGSFVSTKPTLAVYKAKAESPVVNIETTSSTEMDGCMKVRMTLAPGSVSSEIKGLWLSIPLKDDIAPLYHVVQSDSIRLNPNGPTPKGTGIVWDSTKTGNGPMLGTMLPYIWLGGPERGLAWFANNDKGMFLDDDVPAQTITRENGKLTLRVYIVNKPTTLKQPTEIVFGLQVSPTRPMPSNWRARQDVPYMGGSNGYWGIVPSFAGKYPAGCDFSYADNMVICRESGIYPAEFMKKWVAEKIDANKGWSATWKEDRTRHVGAGMGSMVGKGSTPTVAYIEEHRQDTTTPEWVTFQDEWAAQGYDAHRVTEAGARAEYDAGRIWGVPICFDKSYQDFAVYMAVQWYLRGIGPYNDNVYPQNCFDPMKSDAYVRPDGQVQASANIWELREYHKRQWIAEQDAQPLSKYELFISNHMTNANMLPVLTWGDVALDNEWGFKAGSEPWPGSILQTEMIGRQTGNYGFALYPVSGVSLKSTYPKLKDDQIARTEWGMRFAHEIFRGPGTPMEKLVRDFGYGNPDCKVINYWSGPEVEPGCPIIKIDNPNVLWTAIWNPKDKSLLIAATNWTNDAQSSPITITAPKGAILTTWTNAETGKPVIPGQIELRGFEMGMVKVVGNR